MLDISVIEFLKTIFDNFFNYFIDILLRLPGVVVAVIVHGFAQALVAAIFGDKGPRSAKKLSIDPLTHTDPIGFLCLLLFRFGWAYPVSINMKDKKYPRLMRFTAIFSGSLANLIVGFLGVFLLIPFSIPGVLAAINTMPPAFIWFFAILRSAVNSFCLINVNMAIFSLIPLPPLDGFRLLSVFIPRRAYQNMMRYQSHFSLGFMIVLLIDYYFFGFIGDAFLKISSFILNDCFAGLINLIFF
jgi:Zn-dependent protease